MRIVNPAFAEIFHLYLPYRGRFYSMCVCVRAAGVRPTAVDLRCRAEIHANHQQQHHLQPALN